MHNMASTTGTNEGKGERRSEDRSPVTPSTPSSILKPSALGAFLKPSPLSAHVKADSLATPKVSNASTEPLSFKPNNLGKFSLPESSTKSSSESNSSSVHAEESVNGDGTKSRPLSNDNENTSTTEKKVDKEALPVDAAPTLAAPPTFVFGENIDNKVTHVSAPPCQAANAEEKASSSSGETICGGIKKPSVAHLEKVSVISGEENEIHVLQMNCKAFMFDKARQWIPKGLCYLRLNDLKEESEPTTSKQDSVNKSPSRTVAGKSRLILRTHGGGMRVLFNTYVLGDMLLTFNEEKEVRLSVITSNTDGSSSSGVFSLSLLSKEDASQLYNAIRIRKEAHTKHGNSDSLPPSTTSGIKRKVSSGEEENGRENDDGSQKKQKTENDKDKETNGETSTLESNDENVNNGANETCEQ